MTSRERLVYVLHHAWLWPLEFWLRPLDVMDRLKQPEQKTVEFISALLGSAFWGALAGVSVWLRTGEIQAIWVLAGAGIVNSTVVFYGVIAFIVVVVAVVAVATNDADVVAVAVAYIAVATGAGTIALSVYGGANIAFAVVVVGAAVVVSAAAATGVVAIISTIVSAQIPILSISFITFLAFGLLVNFFGDHKKSSWTATKRSNLRLVKNQQISWLMAFWLLFTTLVLVVWFYNLRTAELNTKLNILAIFCVFAPIIFTGLPFWPIVSLFSIWRFCTHHVSLYTHTHFTSGIPFSWQTFAYPLPGIRKYLTGLCSKHGPATALQAIQAVQFRSLQMLAARRAALDLATHPDTALPFCGQVAMTTNTATLVPLSLTGHAAKAVAALAAKQEKEDEQPLQLYVGNLPKLSDLSSDITELDLSLSKYITKLDPSLDIDIVEFQGVRQQGLRARLDYALNEIRLCQSGIYLSEFRTLLEALSNYTNTNLIQSIKLLSRYPEKEADTNSAWLDEGWLVLRNIQTILTPLEIYREIKTQNDRRGFLEHKIQELSGLYWYRFSEYWGNIGKELVAHWINLLTEEAKQAREWLSLEIQLTNENLTVGQQTLQFQIFNPTATLARDIQISMDALPGLEWHHAEAKRGILEGGKTALMSCELEAHEQGRYRITGRLAAKDISGNPFSLPFAFQLNIAQVGHRYQLQDRQLYVIGECLGDDRTFAGRQDLLRWLRSLWLQPGDKAAVVLVGQRRIGKTSLLNKIKRDGLPDTRLLPVLINIQGVSGDYDLLNSIAREMAVYLNLSKPSLNRDNPYPDFKEFLLSLKPKLDQQRFLLMLDEAERIFYERFSDMLPDFLRALMQEPEYPTLLLFCGTHALKRMSLEYSSILFNTAQFRTISYMTAAESAEVLEKPARDILEFDPAALKDAYRLTRGQPLLLQSLGATLINRFDDIVRDGGERSNYVNLNDLNKAADELVRQGNAAFENHWEDSDPATHRILSTLAWATDETNRLQLDLPGIEARMSEVRLVLPAGTVFKIVERLADEEILLREGPTYRFAVPLYRRWIDWRWPPARVREEPLG
ncbi:MAG: hypothetical protein U1F76_04895 [Candidatus Competibacteraceae bacterium]